MNDNTTTTVISMIVMASICFIISTISGCLNNKNELIAKNANPCVVGIFLKDEPQDGQGKVAAISACMNRPYVTSTSVTNEYKTKVQTQTEQSKE